MSSTEFVILVDEQDRMLGIEEKIKAHELALLHRAFSIFVYRKSADVVEFLLQKRHMEKYHCGGLWTNACCSHPRVGETVLEAATRRLKEEMALALPLRTIGTFCYRAEFLNGLTEHELDHVLLGEYDELQTIKTNPVEVESYRWIEAHLLKEELAQSPEKFTPWFKPAYHLVLEELCLNY